MSTNRRVEIFVAEPQDAAVPLNQLNTRLGARFLFPYRDAPDKCSENEAQYGQHHLLPSGWHHEDGTAK